MKCDDIRERMPEVPAGFGEFTVDESKHLASCDACTGQLSALRQTMALLDEWQAPEPSPYFDTRLQARLREEIAKPAASWVQWWRKPALALSLGLAMLVGITFFHGDRDRKS